MSKERKTEVLFGNKRLSVLVIGTDGMFGHDLYQILLDRSRSRHSRIGIVHGVDDAGIEREHLRTRRGLSTLLGSSIHYDYVVNCIAYTDTKGAENDGKPLSYELNATVPMYFARACLGCGTKFIHISTDYVFSEWSDSARRDAFAANTKFTPTDTPAPKNTYGLHKLVGEGLVMDVFKERPKDVSILRTSWLYGNHGHKSFVHRFLSNIYDSKEGRFREGRFDVTCNEFSIPTSTQDLSACVIDTMTRGRHGILHATNESLCGITVSRIDFANEILSEIRKHYGEQIDKVVLNPVSVHGMHPLNSTLETSFDLFMDCKITWHDSLEAFIGDNFCDIMEWLDRSPSAVNN